jgi:hypothetical protein
MCQGSVCANLNKSVRRRNVGEVKLIKLVKVTRL